MSDTPISRRDAMKLAKLGVLLTAGLGVCRLVDAKTGEPVGQGGVKENKIGMKEVGEFITKNRIPPGTFLNTTFQYTEAGLELVSIVPLRGDLKAALNDPKAILSIKIKGEGKDGKTYSINEIAFGIQKDKSR